MTEAEIKSPSRVVMFGDMKVGAMQTGTVSVNADNTFAGGYLVSPDGYPSDDACTTWNNAGWGSDDLFNNAVYGSTINNAFTGTFMPRHNGGGSLAFMFL